MYNCRDEKLTYFLHDKEFVREDLYSLFSRIMKLGLKNLYFDIALTDEKAQSILEDVEMFFSPTIDVSNYTFLYIRCYRMISITLQELDPDLYNSLREKSIIPPMLFLYYNLTL